MPEPQQATEAPQYLRPAEVAKLLRMSLDSVYRLLADGKLAGVRRGEGGGWLIARSAVDDYLVRPRGPAVTPSAEAERERRELVRRGILPAGG